MASPLVLVAGMAADCGTCDCRVYCGEVRKSVNAPLLALTAASKLTTNKHVEKIYEQVNMSTKSTNEAENELV